MKNHKTKSQIGIQHEMEKLAHKIFGWVEVHLFTTRITLYQINIMHFQHLRK